MKSFKQFIRESANHFINNNMEYLTNYYKNLCEELSGKEKAITKLLNEMNVSAAGGGGDGFVQHGPPTPGAYPTAPKVFDTDPNDKPKPAPAPRKRESGPSQQERDDIARDVWNRYYRQLVQWMQRGQKGPPPMLPSVSAPPGYVGPFPGLPAPWNLHPPPQPANPFSFS